MLELVLVSGALGGAMLSALGFYVSRLRLASITFAVAHAALAGAAIAMVIDLDAAGLAMVFSVATGVVLGLLSPRLSDENRNNIAMMLFSLFNATAILSIYLSNTTVLATTSVGSLLWGSILAITPEKLACLAVLATLFATYVAMYKRQLDTIVFDPRLAEAEGVNVVMHSLVVITLSSVAIALLLKIVGGFLVFTLIYVPVLAANSFTSRADRQLTASIALGASSCLIGTGVSYALDLPIGASIALTTSSLASVTMAISIARNTLAKKKVLARYLGSRVNET